MKLRLVHIVWQSFVVMGQGDSEILPLNHHPSIFLRGGPQISDRQSPSAHTSNHMWKLQGDRPSHLGDIAPQSATKKQTNKPQQNISPPGTTVPVA